MTNKTKAEKIKAALKAAQPQVTLHDAPVEDRKYSSIELVRSLALTLLIVALIVLVFALQTSNYIG
ncbi:MAG: hypothetical protein WCO78_02060 [Candidatus Roizmanbacteria bacterium]